MFARQVTNAAVLNAGRVRFYSTIRPSGFLTKFRRNFKWELETNKDLKDNIHKFRDEAKKLQQSDALRQARRKFEIVESKADNVIFKQQIDGVKQRLNWLKQQMKESELGKKASQAGKSIGKSAKTVASSVSSTKSFQAVSHAAGLLRDEIDFGKLAHDIYKPPAQLRKRSQAYHSSGDAPEITPNTEVTGVELHKDSKFYQSWEKFKDNNPCVKKMFEWKVHFDESENPVIKASRLLTNKVSEVVSGLFQRTELSDTLTEIMTFEPTFDKDKFLVRCERDIIPNILEAMCKGDLNILEDWCYKSAFAIICVSFDFEDAVDSQILDISNVELTMGKVLEAGPALVINFTSQQVKCIRSASSGKIVEGGPKVHRINHIWVLCRDRSESNPLTAWKLLDLEQSKSVSEPYT